MLRINLTKLLLFAGLVFNLSSCATNPVTGKQDFMMISQQQEINLGKKYHQQVLKQYKLYDDPKLQAYVERLGQQLAAKSHRDNLFYHFYVLDSPVVNAFALPGGYIYITRGIISYMNQESELAGVLGHELGHVTARHGAKAVSKQQLTGILATAAAVATGVNMAGDLSSILGAAILSGYGRNAELEADRLGAEYLARTGYDPADMIDVVGILKAQEEFEKQRAEEEGRQPQTYHGIFATHPKNDQRLKQVIDEAKSKQTTITQTTSPEEFLAYLDGLVFGAGQAQGITRGNRFYHSKLDFTITFPPSWRIENGPASLVSTAKTNDIKIAMGLDDLNFKEPADLYLKRKYPQVDQLTPISTTQGLQGYTGVAIAKTPYGTKPSRVAAVFDDDRAFIVIGMHKDKGRLPDDAFFNTVKSIRHLNKSDQALAKQLRIRIVTAEQGDTFAKLAENSTLPNYAQAQLRMLNGMFPSGEPKVGQKIKIIE